MPDNAMPDNATPDLAAPAVSTSNGASAPAGQKIIEQIRNALGNLVTLEIVTAVGSIQFPSSPSQPGEEALPDLDLGQPFSAILTKINLLQGDIRTVFTPEFVTGDYASLRDFHAQREAQGHEIIQSNIKALESLLSLAQRKEMQPEKQL